MGSAKALRERPRASVSDPVFLVTGAASGLGEALVSRLAAVGHRVIAADACTHRLEETARRAAWPMAHVRLAPLDVREPNQWSSAFALGERAFGGVDVLLHAAAHRKAGEAYAAAAAEVHRHLDVNAKGTAFALQAAADHMLARGGGHAIVFSSLNAFAPRPGLGLYSAAAAAARSLSLATDLELRPRGLPVTVVCTAAEGLPTGAPDGEAELWVDPSSSEEVVDAELERVLPARPRELVVPLSRGLAARLAGLSASIGAFLWNRSERRHPGRRSSGVRAGAA